MSTLHDIAHMFYSGQFPDAMENLSPVTQLYVSVDAGNKESMRAVDRPLFSDFWERFLSCLDILGRKVYDHFFQPTLYVLYANT